MDVPTMTVTSIPPTLQPAISPDVHLSLTIVYTILYGFLFAFVYVQLWMIWYYRHKRFSYQTVFLFLCLFWAGLRTTLFSFYYVNCVDANNLNAALYWLLYCCPVCLQFVTLCLLVIFFAGVYFKGMPIDTSEKYRKPLYVVVTLSIIVFLATNVTCAVILKQHDNASDSVPVSVSLVRVAISGSLFILMGALLALCLYKMSKISSTSVVLEAKGMTMRQAIVFGILIILLYTSRALYNFIAISMPLISFGYGWVNVSDQADFQNLDKGFAYVSFGIVLFVWEFLPTFIDVIFFRVRKPNKMTRVLSSLPSDSFHSRAYFFDNPRRYDSDDDIHRHIHGNDSLLDTSGPFTINSAGSSHSYLSNSQTRPAFLTPTTPPIFSIAGAVQVTGGPVDHVPTPDSFYDGT